MKLIIKILFLITFSRYSNAAILLSPQNLIPQNYKTQILESYELESFTDYYINAPVKPAAQKKLRKAFTEANNFYQSGNYNKAVNKLKKVLSYKHSADWTSIYRNMIASAAKKLSTIDPDNSGKWQDVYLQFNNQDNTITYDMSAISTEAQFLVNGVLQTGTTIQVPKNTLFRLTLISNKYMPASVVTNLDGLKTLEYRKRAFVSKSCSLAEQNYLNPENIKIAYHKDCNMQKNQNFKELFKDDTSLNRFEKYKVHKKKKNKWLLLGAGLIVGTVAYSYSQSQKGSHSKDF